MSEHGMFNGSTSPEDRVIEGGPGGALQPEHVLATGSRSLLGDTAVMVTHQRLYQATIQQAIYNPDSAERDRQRQMFLALEALFAELQRMARGEITDEDELLAQGALNQRGRGMQPQPEPMPADAPEIFPGDLPS